MDFVERVTGIEPALSAWEADVLPLNYTRERGYANASVPALDHAGLAAVQFHGFLDRVGDSSDSSVGTQFPTRL